MPLSIVILAAGLGKRMHSDIPKVLHRLAGKPLLEHIITTARAISSEDPIVVIGHESEKIRHAFAHLDVQWVKQEEQLGTGHAVQQALPLIAEDQSVLVLCGDVPLVSTATLKKFISTTPAQSIGILTANFPDPEGLGRIIRTDSGKITSVIEEKDADEKQRALQEINTGIYLIPAALLKKWLPLLKNSNTQKEYYLTDIIALACKENIAIQSLTPAAYEEVSGVNDRSQLAILERYYQNEFAKKLMRQGVTLQDPTRLDVRGELSVGQDVTIDINVIIEGHVKIGSHCTIGANTLLRNVIMGDHVDIKSHCVIDGAEISEHCVIGPFARLRPGTVLGSQTHIGNFVEIKNSDVGLGSKINHLSYIGDSEIGKHVNIGAGTITCNYDGVNKQRTVIGDYAFIGSDTQLIAPVTIGEGATIGAGSTITRDAPANELTICRVPQRSIKNWQRPKKKET
jgi:bifunctional UDP-N-acetylglucosamine pyrophosphorylase/glucosamine-1-phosphate N-acetyltransferase